jgi:uncharacterized protein Usg
MHYGYLTPLASEHLLCKGSGRVFVAQDRITFEIPAGTSYERQLILARIFYHLPDYPLLLQEFIWQKMDLPPEFAELLSFLEFWSRSIVGRLNSVIITPGHLKIPSGNPIKYVEHEFTLH